MLIFELIKNKVINICKMIKSADAGKTPSYQNKRRTIFIGNIVRTFRK